MKMDKKITNTILWLLTMTVSLVIIGSFAMLLTFVSNQDSKNKYLRDNPVKQDSTFVLKLSYVNGISEIEEIIVPSDAKFYVKSGNGTYALIYDYNINMPNNTYSSKLIKYGVVNFKVIKDEK